MLREGAPVKPDPSSPNWKPEKKVIVHDTGADTGILEKMDRGVGHSRYKLQSCKLWSPVGGPGESFPGKSIKIAVLRNGFWAKLVCYDDLFVLSWGFG